MVKLRDLPPLNVPQSTGLGRVYAPAIGGWMPVWIQDGALVCAACVVPRHLQVKFDPAAVSALTPDQQRQFAALVRQYPKALRA